MFGDFLSSYLLLYLLVYGGVIIFIFFIVIRAILRAIRGSSPRKPIGAPGWFLQMSLSKEDAYTQWFWLLAWGFFGVTLFTLNRQWGGHIVWHTILLICVLVALAAAYFFRALYVLAFSLIGSVIWWTAKSAEWAAAKNLQTSAVLTTIVFMSLLMIVIGTLHESRIQNKRAAFIYEFLGILILAIIMLLLSSNYGLDFFQSLLNGGNFSGAWQLSIGLLVWFALLCAAIWYGLIKRLLLVPEAVSMGLLVILFTIVAFVPQQEMRLQSASYLYGYSSGITNLSDAGVLWSIAFNIITLLGMLSVLLAGYLRRENWQINFGAVLLCIFVFIKYFDWFYSSLDKSAFFLGAGILLLFVGFVIERGRIRKLQKINNPGAAHELQ